MFTFPVGFLGGSTGTEDPYWNNLSLYLPMTGTNGSTTFIDSSSYTHTITPSGNAQISTAQFPTLSGINSSGLFDGNGDFLTCGAANLPEYDLGTGDFTMRAFIRLNATVNNLITIFYLGADGSGSTIAFGWEVLQNNTGLRFFSYQSTAIVATNYTGTIAINTWHYVGVTRTSGTLALWLNGSQVASNTNTQDFNRTTGRILRVARYTADSTSTIRNFPGNISHLQMYKGVSIPLNTIPSTPFPVG